MSWLHLSDTKPKARKCYNCVLCEQFIPPGTVHVARRGICDDGPITTRMHVVCEALTHAEQWDEAAWEYHDYGEFQIHINRLLPENLNLIQKS
jgi:hypothetical protein